MDKRKIILDCDPGHDDAIAILLAVLDPSIDLLGISVSCGNQTIEKTSNNALNMVEFLNVDIPVSIGANKPLVNPPYPCAKIHGESGLDGVVFPPHTKSFDKRIGANLIIDLCKENKDVTVVTTGPMTNFALALSLDPSIKENIKEVIFMGGSMNEGNVTPAAEFNVYVDPEAASIVCNSGLTIKMVGLDVTRKVLVLPSIMERMKKLNTKSSELFYNLMVFFNKSQKEVFGLEGGPLHDPATIVSIIDNNVITFEKMNVEIDLSHGASYGRTNCSRSYFVKKENNVYVAIDIDVNRYWDIIEENLRRF